MASKRSLQQFLEGDDDKGKKVAVEGGDEDKGLQKVDIDSSSESDIDVEDENLDIWEREARRLHPPKEDTTKWRPWSAREDLIIFVGACHARAVLRQQMLEGQVFEDEDPVAAQIEQVAEDQDMDVDQDASIVDQDVHVDPAVPVDPTASNDQLTSADAQTTVADLSSDPLPTN